MTNYCSTCGLKLIVKEIPNEGLIPYCERCQSLRFPTFSTAMSTLVLNQQRDKILLIKQGGREKFILVAGYVTLGESVEATVRREVKEEVGLDVTALCFLQSQYYEPSNTLMLNFESIVSSEKFLLKEDEVEAAEWFSFSEAKEAIVSKSLAESFLLSYLARKATS